ncbi:MAG: type II toxin-antitoxin system VapC family toxin [Spirochaetales bacterium]
MSGILVDTNIVLDIVTADSNWLAWSLSALESSESPFINPIIYSELCTNATSTGELDALLANFGIQLREIPRQGLFLAAKAHQIYRSRGGTRTTGLPDFFIGAHAQALGVNILTRDPGRFTTYFPSVALVVPPLANW